MTGKAKLYMDRDWPFDEGVYFSPTFPGSRFVYDLDQLSGGQKSLASLALQYAISLSSKSPFLILDEADCFLDGFNIRKLVSLFKSITQGRHDFSQTTAFS